MNNLTQISEEFVRNRVLEWLSKQGYGVISKVATLGEHGADLKVRKTKSMNFYIIEVKGDKGSDKARHVSFVTALGEILQRVKYIRHCKYAVAFPESYMKIIQRRLPWRACKKLPLEVLLVNPKGQIRRLIWRDLKKLQTKAEKITNY